MRSKKKRQIFPILAGIIGFSFFILIIFWQITESKEIRIEGDSGSAQLDFSIAEECVLWNTELTECLQFSQFSVIDANYTIAESDNDAVNNFIESIEGKFEQFGIEIVSVKYNIAGESQSFSTIFPVQLLAGNIVSGGFIVDNVQVAFNAVTKDKFSSFNLEGVVEFKLDDKIIATKKLWTSSSLGNEQVVALNVVDSVPPPAVNRPVTFDFTFTDEGFVTGDMPVFTVTLKSIKGTYQAGGVSKTFDWQGDFLAYTLELVVNEDKTTILDEAGNVVSINKDDSTLIVCGQSAWTTYKYTTFNRNTVFYYRDIPASTTSDVAVFDEGGTKVGEIKSFTSDLVGTSSRYNSGITPVLDCKKFTGLMRDTAYIIKVENKEFPVTTPIEQHNYSVTFSTSGKIVLRANCDPSNCNNTLSGYTADISSPLIYSATSNFGYSKP